MADQKITPTPAEKAPAAEAHPTEPSPRDPRDWSKYLNGFLAALVSVYSILTAVVVYSASQAQDAYYRQVFHAQAALNDASELAIEGHINVLHDLNVVEKIYIQELTDPNPEITEFLLGHLSAPAQDSLARSGEFDDLYAEEVYAAHNENRELAMELFEQAIHYAERGGTFETIATILAVGLAFAAWASLMEQTVRTRWWFAAIAGVILLGSVIFLGITLVTSEPLALLTNFLM
jgi:hypothetical protein